MSTAGEASTVSKAPASKAGRRQVDLERSYVSFELHIEGQGTDGVTSHPSLVRALVGARRRGMVRAKVYGVTAEGESILLAYRARAELMGLCKVDS